MSGEWSDQVRYAGRTLRRSPGFALTGILTLTLTLALNVALFATVNAIALRRLPAPQPDRLVRLSTAFRTGQEVPFSFPMFRELVARQTAIDSLVGWTFTSRVVEARGTLVDARVTGVTGNYFAELGVVPTAGRLLQPQDVDLEAFLASAVAVAGHGFWQRVLDGSPSAVGSTVLVDGVPLTIVGIAPRGFKGFGLMIEADLIVPLTAPAGGAPENYAQAGLLWLRIAGRLRSDVTLERARAELDAVWPAIKADIVPPTHAGAQRENFLGLPLRIDSLAHGHEPLLQGYRGPLFALQALALLALLIGCLNLASLTLRRLAGREPDRAIRTALGATPWQAVRPAVVEVALIALAGALCALPIGLAASRAITRAFLPDAPGLSLNTAPDARVFAFVATAAVLAVALVAWLPAWHSARRAQRWLQPGHRSSTASGPLLRLLVVGQLALSVVLLTNAGLLVRSLQRVLSIDVGFDTRGLARALFTPRPGASQRPDDDAYYPALIEAVEALPGAARAGIANIAPGNPGFPWLVSPMDWDPADGISAVLNAVTPGFFPAVGLPIVAGRDLSWSDHARAPRVAILTRGLADRLFPDGRALGRRVRIGTQPYRQDLDVVGIVADARLYGVKDASSHAAYIAQMQNSEPHPGGWLILRGRADAPALQQAVQSVGPDFVRVVESVTDAFAAATTLDRNLALLGSLFAAVTLALAALGVAGLFAYSVALRTREIAIRLAIGGEPRQIVASIVQEGARIALGGAVLGVILHASFSGPVRPLLFGIGPLDPPVIVGVPLLLAAVALAACLIPAVRAARTDPTIGLRVE